MFSEESSSENPCDGEAGEHVLTPRGSLNGEGAGNLNLGPVVGGLNCG